MRVRTLFNPLQEWCQTTEETTIDRRLREEATVALNGCLFTLVLIHELISGSGCCSQSMLLSQFSSTGNTWRHSTGNCFSHCIVSGIKILPYYFLQFTKTKPEADNSTRNHCVYTIYGSFWLVSQLAYLGKWMRWHNISFFTIISPAVLSFHPFSIPNSSSAQGCRSLMRPIPAAEGCLCLKTTFQGSQSLGHYVSVSDWKDFRSGWET